MVGVNGDEHRSGLLGKPSSSVLVKVPRRANHDRFALWMHFLRKSKSWRSLSGRMCPGTESIANCTEVRAWVNLTPGLARRGRTG